MSPDRRRRRRPPAARSDRDFDYSLDYAKLDLRKTPEVYRVGRGEQGVLLVEPYKGEILPHWRFKTPQEARASSRMIARIFRAYRKNKDFVGMDMARKFMQMGYTRARRYANRKSGRKYGDDGRILPIEPDEVKARSAAIFYEAWQRLEDDPVYSAMKADWKARYG